MSLALRMGLSVASVRAERRRLEEYVRLLPARCDELCRRLAEMGVDAAVAGVTRAETGELASSIRHERRGERDYVVIADCGYAVYVEFGTGVVGLMGSAGELPDGITGPTSRTTKAREDGSWVYWDERQGKYRITRGQAPLGFMSGAATEMRERVLEVAREVFAGD